MNLSAIGKRCLSLLLCLIIIFSTFAAVPVSATQTGSADFVLQTVYPSEIVSLLYGEISDAEADFLDGELQNDVALHFTVEYDAFSLTDAIDAQIKQEGGKTVVSVAVEQYTSDGLTWMPVSATVLLGSTSNTAELDADGRAQVVFENTSEAKYATVSVKYEAKITYSQRVISSVANAAYNAGEAAIKAIEKYDSDLVLYDQKLNAYLEYRQKLKVYEDELRKYNEYLDLLSQYESELDEYNAYLLKLDEYGVKLAEYQAYLLEYQSYSDAYAEYLDFLKNPQKYEDMYKKYIEYCEKRELMELQLSYIDSAFVSDAVGHVLYATLHGDTVATVVQNQDALVSTGCDANDIANADRSTKELTALLDAYPRGGDVDTRYAFYIKHYSKLRESVTTLYSSLARLYTNDAVPSILEAKDRLERYWQFVSQLYVLHCALDDGAVFNPNWTIAGASPSELLDDCYMLADSNSAAPMTKIPEVVDEAQDPSKIQKPTPPKVVQKPQPPIEIDEPIKPAEVVKPLYPAAVVHPEKQPAEPIFSRAVSVIVDEIKAGKLTKRDVSEDGEISLTLTAQKAVGAEGFAVAGFYEKGAAMLSDVVTVAIGDELDLPTPKAREFADREHSYIFAEWKTADHTTTSNGAKLTEDTCFTAAYVSDARLYSIAWNTGEEIITTQHAYGTVPSYNGIISVPDSDEFSYYFSSWSPMPSAVVSDAEYTAQYTSVRRSYTVKWIIGDQTVSEEYEYGSTPEFNRSDLISAHIQKLQQNSQSLLKYSFDGWDKEISTVTGNITYTAVFSTVELIPDVDKGIRVGVTVDNLSLTIAVKRLSGEKTETVLDISQVMQLLQNRVFKIELDGYTLHFSKKAAQQLSVAGVKLKLVADASNICVDILDINGESVAAGLGASAVYSSGEVLAAVRLYCDGELCDLTVSDSYISFALLLGKKYKLLRGAYINVSDADGGACVVESDSFATVGEKITVSVLARPGYAVSNFAVRLAGGGEVEAKLVDGNYVFVMPNEDVFVSAEFERLRYTVKFMSDGKLLSQRRYYYGDSVLLPNDPVKNPDGENTYAFIGWDSPVRQVDGDVIYNAVFLASPILEGNSVPEAKLGLLDMILIAFASAVVCASGILCAFFIVRMKKNRHKKQNC